MSIKDLLVVRGGSQRISLSLIFFGEGNNLIWFHQQNYLVHGLYVKTTVKNHLQ